MTEGKKDAVEPQDESFDGVELVGREFLGRYRLLERAGEGGMSVVFKALHMKMDRVVAVKVLSRQLMQDADQVRSFNKEAFACSRLSHPNTIQVFDFGESSDGYLFLVMEFLEGETLGDLLRQQGRLDMVRALHIVRQIFKSLAEAHSVGIIHRDMKPDNVFITNIYGEQDYVKVLDFGIAKVLERGVQDEGTHPGTGKVWGSPLYLSPEQFLETPMGPQSDLYSVGCMLYEMLVGVPPFVGKKAIDVVMAHVEEEPRSIREMAPDRNFSEQLDHAVLTLLSKDPKARPTTADHAIALLDDALVADGHAVFSDNGSESPQNDQGQVKASPTAATVLRRHTSQAVPKSPSSAQSEAHAPRTRRWLIPIVLLAVLGIALGITKPWDQGGSPPNPGVEKHNPKGQVTEKPKQKKLEFARPEAVRSCAKCLHGCTSDDAQNIDMCNTACVTRWTRNEKERQRCEGAFQERQRLAAEMKKQKALEGSKPPPPKPVQRYRTVLITSTPPGAQILVDDLPLGEAPVAFRNDTEGGSHEVVVQKKGFTARTILLTQDLVKALPKEGLKVELTARPKPVKRKPKKKKKKSRWKQW